MTTQSQTVSQAVATRDSGPQALIKQYSTDFARVLPSHIKSDSWIRLAQGALRRGKRTDGGKGPFELEVAAANNPGVFLAALLDAARQGLEPGTEEYYLTPRRVKGRLEILGITGYQGYIELMYRAGAVSSIVAEVVRENDDYRYQRGVDEVPVHIFKPFAREADRGPLIGVYAYARMNDGAVSRVIELSQDDIDRAKKASQGSDSEYSPWVTSTAAMWLKTAVRQLRKWVPTSAEYRREQLRAAAEAHTAAAKVGAPVVQQVEEYVEAEIVEDDISDVDPDTGEVLDPPTEPEQDGIWGEAAKPGSGIPAGRGGAR